MLEHYKRQYGESRTVHSGHFIPHGKQTENKRENCTVPILRACQCVLLAASESKLSASEYNSKQKKCLEKMRIFIVSYVIFTILRYNSPYNR